MRTQAPSPQPASDDASRAAPDFARPVLEEQLAGLARLARMGLRIVEGLERLVDQAEADKASGDNPAPSTPEAPAIALAYARAYARASKAVRLTYALQSKVIEDLRRVGRIEGAEAAEAVRHREAQVRARKDRIARVVTRIIEGDAEDDEAYERLVGEASERLCDRESFGDVLRRPMSDLIAQICGDLGLSPDWACLSTEAWAQEEIGSGVVGDALARLINSPSPWMGEGPGAGAPPRRADPRKVRPRRKTGAETVTDGAKAAELTPVDPAPPEPPPPPIPALSPIQGRRVERARPARPPPASAPLEWVEPEPTAPPWRPPPHEGPHVLPGELPPPRRPRPCRAWT